MQSGNRWYLLCKYTKPPTARCELGKQTIRESLELVFQRRNMINLQHSVPSRSEAMELLVLDCCAGAVANDNTTKTVSADRATSGTTAANGACLNFQVAPAGLKP